MLKEGTYSARARGMAGFVGVTLTVADNKISTVDLDLSTETPQYGQKAEKTLKQEIWINNLLISTLLLVQHLLPMGLKRLQAKP